MRTVKRWEKDEKLPVHRHVHKSLASVYAYEYELEAWRKSRGAVPVPQQRPEAAPRRHNLIWGTLSAVAVLVAVAAAYWASRPSELPFEQRDWALIAQFENRTGEAVFDGTTEYALEREISNSRFVNVVPRERISDVLRLMKKPLDTVIDRSIGREICLRDGNINALIAGRVEKLDSTYIVSATLINPATGVTIASFSERAVGQRDVVGAIQRLAGRVRESLGEEMPRVADDAQKLERVSTPSLRALQLYSHADALIRAHRSDQALELLRAAVQEDPGFASGHVLLAHSLSNVGRDQEAGPHYQRALELSRNSTDAERLFIQSSYDQRFLKDRVKAVQSLEPLVRLYPDHYWAVSNLAVAYESLGESRRASQYIARRAELRPHNFDHQLRAGHALLLAGRPNDADRYVERARHVLAAEQDDPFRAWRGAWLRLYPVHARWIRRDLEGAISEANKLARQVDTLPQQDRTPLQWELGSFYLNVGRADAAVRMFRGMRGSPENLALIATGLGDQGAAVNHLRSTPPSHRAAILMARAGLVSEAEKAAADPSAAGRAYAPFQPGIWGTLARGELALARGRNDEAIALLEDALPRLRAWPTPYFFLGVDALSRAWQEQGDTARSLAVLEEASPYGDAAVFWGPAPFFWMSNEMRRAELYRATGREADSRRVEAELSKLLAHADP